MVKNWKNSTLEKLENDYWKEPAHDSQLIIRCHQLRKAQLDKFTVEDLRVMIGQQIGLTYLIRLALDILEKELFAEGDYFEGDLLKNVLDVDTAFWKENKDYWRTLFNIIKDRRQEISNHKFDTSKFDKANG